HLTALMTLMIQSGLIVDVGYTECIVTPVIEGVTNFDSVQFAPLGGKAIHESILCELRKLKAKIKTSNETTILSDDFTLDDKILENIKVRTCFVAPFERREYLRKNDSENIENSPRDVQYPIDGSRILELPGVVREKAAEILFEEFENEQSIATLILDALLRCPLDSRKILASNIVLVGGSCMLPGFKYRLMMELKHLVNHPRYKEKIFFKSFLFHNPPCKENYVSWLGASIFGSTDAINTRCISREQYLKTNGKVLVDWCDWYPPKNSIVDMFYSLNENLLSEVTGVDEGLIGDEGWETVVGVCVTVVGDNVC
ncbi:actin-related protein 10-like protein, partial [Dinothrombium tinctorium]